MPLARGCFVAVLLALLASGCGAAGGSGAEPKSAPAREPLTELDALQRDFDVSEARLTAQLERQVTEPASAQEKKKAEATPPAEAAPAPQAATAPRDKDRADDEAATGQAQAEGSVGSACDLVCRALGSMRRSADGICSLTSEQHERCTTARGRVERAARQVSAAGCLCRP